MPLNWSAPSTGFTHFNRLSVYISASGLRSFKIRMSSNIPARMIVISSESPSGFIFRPKSGVPIIFVRGCLPKCSLMVQTTVRTEIIPNIISTIWCFCHFFRISRDIQFCTFDDIIVGIGCPGKLATIETVAQSLVENKIRLGSQKFESCGLY